MIRAYHYDYLIIMFDYDNYSDRMLIIVVVCVTVL